MTPQEVAQALACGRSSCPCVATARRGRGNTHCPAHEDQDPSLTLSVGEDGKLLVHCQASCLQKAVIGALRERRVWPEAQRAAEGLSNPCVVRGVLQALGLKAREEAPGG